MNEPIGFGVPELQAEERGLLLGISLQGLDGSFLARLQGDRRSLCCTAFQTLRALPRAHRAALLVAWIVEANAPFPPGLERLHPSWLAETIADEPTDLWPVLLSDLPARQAVESLLAQAHGADASATDGRNWPADTAAEVQRCVFGQLTHLCIGPCGPVGAGLCRLGCDELLAEVAARGTALCQELHTEGEASLWAVAGRLPTTLGRPWLKW